ncbi:MAG: 3-keto-disaccharide hydrolase [Verrucomicrobiales bacterium]
MNRYAFLALALVFAAPLRAAEPANPFVGHWAFELPDGNPAWLKVEPSAAWLLWSVGSARPVKDLAIDGERLTFTRALKWKPFGEEPVRRISKPITGTIDSSDRLVLEVWQDDGEGGEEKFHLHGKRLPPMPARPDLAAVKFGEPIALLGTDLSGWRIINEDKKKNGWRVEGGVLINETPKTDFTAYGSYGNLRTDREFEDFELTLDYMVESGGNSGIYLRGMYEVQVVDRDSKMQGIQGPGAVFGRIEPSKNAATPPGEWNRYQLTLVDRHITVVLNGETVIDNQPLAGCTGGGMLADDTRPGPIFLQGDHTSVQYRNMTLRPVLR